MELSKINFKTNYKSKEDDVVNDFYIRALSNAVKYDRVSAYFDSKILSMYSVGLFGLNKNKGKVRFVFSHELNESDYEEIKSGYSSRLGNHLANEFANSSKSLSEQEKMLLSNFAFLISTGCIDVKIAFTRKGVFHDKFGLISDACENTIYFRGSNNETSAALLNNYESFETSITWDSSKRELEKIDNAIITFEKLWENKEIGTVVIDMPEVIKNELIKFKNGETLIDERILFQTASFVYFECGNIKCELLNEIIVKKLERNWEFKNFVKRYVSFTSKNVFMYKFESYIDIIKLLDKLNSIFVDIKEELVVDEEVLSYINNKNLEIEKRKSVGIAIKQKDSNLIEKYDEVKEVLSKEMHRTLKEEQIWSVLHSLMMQCSANFSVPGAGKTSIVYGVFAYLNRESKMVVDKIVMIGPKSSFLSWKDEFYENFKDKKKLQVIDIQANNWTKEKTIYELRFNSGSSNLILVNYESLPGLSEVLYEIINEKTLLVFDEVHKIKSVTGERAKHALSLVSKPKYKVILSGTPIPNSYTDLYNLLNILYKDEYKNYFKYDASKLKKLSDREAKDFNEKLYPFYCRITKRELGVPDPCVDSMEYVQMSESEERLFDILRNKCKNNFLLLYIRLLQASTNPKLLLQNVNEEDFINILNISDEISESSDGQMCKIIEPYQFSGEEVELINSISNSSKLEAAIKLVKRLVQEGKQVILWGIFVSSLYETSRKLSDLGITNNVICGKTDSSDRETLIKEFKECKYNVLITNPHTLAESVSLHKTCHDSVYLEYSFNLTHMLQSRDRIHRLGLEKNQYTQYYYMVLSSDNIDYNSFDERTYNRLKEKEQVMLKSIEGTSLDPITQDDLEDAKYILGNMS